MGAGWRCQVLGERGEIELEQLDAAGGDWFAVGPGGAHTGSLHETLQAATGAATDQAWLAVVLATVERDLSSPRRSMVLAKRAQGVWFHTTFADNRESILRHGLDWRRMTTTGIARSRKPEADGVFLCSDLERAAWFARMGRRDGRAVDIWAVSIDGRWLIGDPGASGGGDDVWMICPEPIAPACVKLVRKPFVPGDWE